MSSSSGVQGQAGGVQLPPSLAGQEGEKATNAEKAGSASSVGRGFSNDNSVSFHQDGIATKATPGNDRMVRLPKPEIDPAKAVSPEVLSQVSPSPEMQEAMKTLEDLKNLSPEDLEGEEELSSLKDSLFAAINKSGKGQQGGDEPGYSAGGSGNKELAGMLVGSLNNPETIKEDVGKALKLQDQAFDALDHINNIKSGPPEQVAAFKEAGQRLNEAMLSGDIEDVARILSEVQTKIQNTRMQFDQEAIQASRVKREILHTERIGKLAEAIEKIEEANDIGILGRVAGAIAAAFTVVVAAFTIATGVGAGVGAALIASAVIMVTMTVSQNTGDWMTNMGGLIKDDQVQMALGIGFSVLAAALSLGAGFGPAIKKKVVDISSHLAQKSVNAGATAAKEGAKVGAEAAKEGAKAAAQTAQQSATNAAQQASTAVKETSKGAIKAAADSADDAARETAKATANAAKESADDVAAQIANKTKIYRQAAHVARFMEGSSMVVSGSADIHGARVRHEGEMYQADAQEDLAHITKMQLEMDEWMEAIQRALEEIGSGQKNASDMLSQAQNNKFTIARNI